MSFYENKLNAYFRKLQHYVMLQYGGTNEYRLHISNKQSVINEMKTMDETIDSELTQLINDIEQELNRQLDDYTLLPIKYRNTPNDITYDIKSIDVTVSGFLQLANLTDIKKANFSLTLFIKKSGRSIKKINATILPTNIDKTKDQIQRDLSKKKRRAEQIKKEYDEAEANAVYNAKYYTVYKEVYKTVYVTEAEIYKVAYKAAYNAKSTVYNAKETEHQALHNAAKNAVSKSVHDVLPDVTTYKYKKIENIILKAAEAAANAAAATSDLSDNAAEKAAEEAAKVVARNAAYAAVYDAAIESAKKVPITPDEVAKAISAAATAAAVFVKEEKQKSRRNISAKAT